MKNHMVILFLLGVLILLSSCREDEFFEEPGTNPISTDIPTSITGNLTGLVTDNNQQAIADARVELDGLTTATDENGVFNFENAVALSTGSLVNISKEGYYDGFKFTRFEPGKNSILKIQMVKKNIISTFQSTNQASINVNGAQLDLPANITVRADGSPYSGLVNVEAFWYNPTDENTIQNMPGDLRGINEEGLERQLTTFGMMVVDISDESGQKLELKEGMKATLTFPLPPNANGPDQIPMWHLDEESGVWLEEGKATKVGSTMVAEVSHFSFWNCDAPFEVVNLEGRILSGPEENPVGGIEVVIMDNNQMISGYGYTNNEGVFSGSVPLGNDLTMGIFHCRELISVTEIGSLTEDVNLGDIILEIENQLFLTGRLVDCASVPLEQGFALITIEDNLDLVIANNGQINSFIFPCIEGEGTFQAYNQSNGNITEEILFDLGENLVGLGEVKVCNDEPTEGISYSFFGGELISFTDATVSIVDDTYLHIYAEEAGSSPLNWMELRYYLDGVPQSMGAQNQISFSDKNNFFQTVTVFDPDGTWNQVSGLEVGDPVSGFAENLIVLESVFYNLTIDQIVNTPTITGHVWVDTDEDGVREIGENGMVPDEVEITATSANLFGFKEYYQFFDIDSDGVYSLSGLAPDIEYTLHGVNSVSGERLDVTKYLQGTDVTVDNDFQLDTLPFAQWRNNSTPITLEAEEIRNNFGLGILQ